MYYRIPERPETSLLLGTVAQLVEHRTEDAGVSSSNLFSTTLYTSIVLTVSIMVSKTTGKGSNPFRRAITFGKVGTSTAVANVGLGVGSNPTMKYLNPAASAHGGDLKISNNRTTECSSVG